MAQNQIVIYQIEDGRTQIDVRLENETVWLTQAQMSELFQKTPQNITMHIQNAYKEGELDKSATCKEYLQVQQEGKRKVSRIVKYYDLDVIISVGYRVKSKRGTDFRTWAQKVLNEERLKEALKFLKGIEDDVKTECEKLLDFIREFAKRHKEEKSKLPYHLNVIDELHINENAHSRILMKLLCYQNDKGEYEILQSLLEYMQSKKETFKSIKIDKPTITQEKQRIDLWVLDEDYAIIFENKIYNAKDQEAQICRYIKKTKELFEENKIFVIYLSQDGKEPDDQTWGDYKDKFKDRYLNLSFRFDILHWLRERVLPNIRPKDDYLKCALKQYIDYLDGLFYLRTILKPMIMELKKFIKQKLELENMESQKCYEILDRVINNCQDLIDQMKELRASYVKKICSEKTKEYFKDLKVNQLDQYFTDVTLEYEEGKEILVYIGDDNDGKGYYCEVRYNPECIIEENDPVVNSLSYKEWDNNIKGNTKMWKHFGNRFDKAYDIFKKVVEDVKKLSSN